MKRALLFGSSGLVGSKLLKLLAESKLFDEIVNVVRKSQRENSNGYREIVVDFNRLFAYSHLFEAEVMFCCLGTTLKKAGSKEHFRQVDLEYVVELSRIAERNKVRKFFVISSINAHPFSSNFYLRTKGEMERLVLASDIPEKILLRPSLIRGKRNEIRLAESFAGYFMKSFQWMFIGRFRKYRPIDAEMIAKCMCAMSMENFGLEIVESDQIFDIATGFLIPTKSLYP